MNDNIATPKWLLQHFPNHYDPNPLNNGELRQTDGFSDWKNLTWCNPPYSNPLKWVEHAIKEADKGKNIVMLTRVDTLTKWWLKLVEAGWHVAFFHQRLRFINDKPANFASALWFSPLSCSCDYSCDICSYECKGSKIIEHMRSKHPNNKYDYSRIE